MTWELINLQQLYEISVIHVISTILQRSSLG